MNPLEITILRGLTLSDPFMIASSHWTDNQAAFNKLAEVSPSALTLKTTSKIKGGKGKGHRVRAQVYNTLGSEIGRYSDGDPQMELWDIVTTYQMTHAAKDTLTNSHLGLSVLQGEDYALLFRCLPMDLYAYIELNLKYTFRRPGMRTDEKAITEVTEDLARFLSVFVDKPRLIKLPAEALDWLSSEPFESINKLVCDHQAGYIIANTKRLRVPPCRISPGNLRSHDTAAFERGVIMGDYLFLSTYNALRELSDLRSKEGKPIPPLIATGGITDIGAVIDSMAAGADAVQLCTALDHRGVQIIEWLREQLTRVVGESRSLTPYREELRSSSTAHKQIVLDLAKFDLDEDILLDILERNREEIGKILADSITGALKETSVSDPPECSPTPIVGSQDIRFVVNKGAVGSYLLSLECVRHFQFTPVEISDAKQFRDDLEREHFRWHFAIFARSVVEHIQRRGTSLLGGKYPEILGIVGYANWELVGAKGTNTPQPGIVYHFAGTSSDAARERILPYLFKGTCPPRFEAIDAKNLLPTFRFWKETNTILAKAPLSRIYALLCRDEVKAKWASLWDDKEDLLLVCSREVQTSEEGKLLANRVHNCIATIRDRIEPARSAKELISYGFLSHCARLLGARRYA